MAEPLSVALQISVGGAAEAEAQLRALATALGVKMPDAAGKGARGLQQVDDKTKQLATTARNTAAGMGNLRHALGAVGMQLQDIVVQLQAGQRPLTVLLQQGSQMAAFFGPVPAIVAAVATAVVALGSAVWGLGSAADDAQQRIDALRKSTKEWHELLPSATQNINEFRRALAEMTAAEREAALVALGRRQIDVQAAIRAEQETMFRMIEQMIQKEKELLDEMTQLRIAIADLEARQFMPKSDKEHSRNVFEMRVAQLEQEVAKTRELAAILRRVQEGIDDPQGFRGALLALPADLQAQVATAIAKILQFKREVQELNEQQRIIMQEGGKPLPVEEPPAKPARAPRDDPRVRAALEAQREADRAFEEWEREYHRRDLAITDVLIDAIRERRDLEREIAVLTGQMSVTEVAIAEAEQRMIEAGARPGEWRVQRLREEIALVEQLRAEKHRLEEAERQRERTAQEVSSTMVRGLEHVITTTGTLRDAIAALAQDLARLALRLLILRPLEEQLGLFAKSFLNPPAPSSPGPGPISGPHGLAGRAAQGAVIAYGRMQPFAQGGVIDRPILFPLARGVGLAGEAGPEAILPLRRHPSGRLGVEATVAAAPAAMPRIEINVVDRRQGAAEPVQVSGPRIAAGIAAIDVVIADRVRAAVESGALDTVLARRFGLRRA